MHEVGACHVEAWAPAVPGVVEVFHARMLDYAYPRHCHDTWAVLIVDEGAIRYDLDGRRYAAANGTVTILPPGVVHDGRPAPGVGGFRKRELYLDQGFLPAGLVGAAVDRSNVSDPALWAALARIHRSLADREDAIDEEARLALVGERIAAHLGTCQRCRLAPTTRLPASSASCSMNTSQSRSPWPKPPPVSTDRCRTSFAASAASSASALTPTSSAGASRRPAPGSSGATGPPTSQRP